MRLKWRLGKWKGYNILDLILILTGIIVVTITWILFGSPWYIIVSTLLGLLCVFTQAKGKISTQFIGIIYFCFYIFISYTQKYYGEALLYLSIMLPMYIYGVIHWLAISTKNASKWLYCNTIKLCSKMWWLCCRRICKISKRPRYFANEYTGLYEFNSTNLR